MVSHSLPLLCDWLSYSFNAISVLSIVDGSGHVQ